MTSQSVGSVSTASSSGSSGTGLDYNTFLKLLTAQLKNQDPTSPMDPSQFMNQLAQLSTVEQAMKTNDTMGQVLSELKSTGSRMDMAYIGRKVEAASDSISLVGGSAKAAYTVDGSPASIKIEVTDATGNVVRSTTPAPKTGRSEFTWDGRRSDGTTAADGLYTIKVTAKAADGSTLKTATVVSDTVKEIRTVDGASKLILTGGQTIADTDVLTVS